MDLSFSKSERMDRSSSDGGELSFHTPFPNFKSSMADDVGTLLFVFKSVVVVVSARDERGFCVVTKYVNEAALNACSNAFLRFTITRSCFGILFLLSISWDVSFDSGFKFNGDE